MRLKSTVLYAAVAVSFLIASASAMYLNIVGPVTATINNGGGIFLGKVAPGETIYVSASSATTNVSGTLIPNGWDTLEAINLPSGWSMQASPLHATPVMKMKLTVAPNAANGTYAITLKAVNLGNYSKLGNLTIAANVTVTPEVYNVTASPVSLSTGPGQPESIYITINNTGISDDPFIISASGVPAWNVSDEMISLHGTKDTYNYPVFVDEPGVYNFNMSVRSTTSPLLHYVYPIHLVVGASLLNDWAAVGQGVILSPVILEPAYAFMNFLAQIYYLLIGR